MPSRRVKIIYTVFFHMLGIPGGVHALGRHYSYNRGSGGIFSSSKLDAASADWVVFKILAWNSCLSGRGRRNNKSKLKQHLNTPWTEFVASLKYLVITWWQVEFTFEWLLYLCTALANCAFTSSWNEAKVTNKTEHEIIIISTVFKRLASCGESFNSPKRS